MTITSRSSPRSRLFLIKVDVPNSEERRISADSSPFPVQVLCCTDTLKSIHTLYHARSKALPVRQLQRGLVILVLLHISQFWSFGKSSKNAVLARYHFSVTNSGCPSREELVGVSLEDGTLSSTRFSVKSSSQSRRSRNRSPCAMSMSMSSSLFVFLPFVDFRNWSPDSQLLVL